MKYYFLLETEIFTETSQPFEDIAECYAKLDEAIKRVGIIWGKKNKIFSYGVHTEDHIREAEERVAKGLL